MTPLAVLMAAEVTAQGVDTATLGNILAPNWKSWQNNGSQYYTGGGAIGQPTPITYFVPQHDASGEPTWAQPPYRKYTSQRVEYTTTTTPVAQGLVAVDIVEDVNLGVVSNLVAESIQITLEQGDGSNEVTYNYYTLSNVYVNYLGETVCVLPVPYTSSNPPGPGPGNIYIGLTYIDQNWTTTLVTSLFPSSAALYPVENSPLEPPIGSIT